MNWSLDGFNLSDPASGKAGDGTGRRIGQIPGSVFRALFGRVRQGDGAAPWSSIPGMGDDQFKQRFTNFVPGIEFTRGLRFRDWRPRHNFFRPHSQRIAPGSSTAWISSMRKTSAPSCRSAGPPRILGRQQQLASSNQAHARHTLSSGSWWTISTHPNRAFLP